MPAFMSGGACPLGTTYQVNGVPGEYNGQTQLGSPNTYTVVYQGSASNLPAPVTIQLPVPDPTVWERYEGMRVKVVAASGRLVVTDNYNLGRYGGLTLAGGGLQTQYTELNAPDTQGNLAWLNAARLNQIQLDDGSSRQNPGLLPGRNGQPLSASNTLRAGDSTDAVIGYLDQFDDGKGTLALHENSYRIQPTAPPMFSGDARPVAHDIPAAIRDAGIKVASVNVLNYFTTLGTANFNTPLGNAMGGRGASNAAEFKRQEDKLVAKLLGLDADVMGLMEIQNNGFATPTGTTSNGKSAIQSLTDALNARAGADVYAFVSGPFKSGSTTVAAAGNDAITGGILYKRNRLTPVGPAAVPDRANLAQYRRLLEQDENLLTLLAGGPLPADLPPCTDLTGQALLGPVPAGLRSDLLLRRPDIMAAEHTLRAADASIGAARAAFFPAVSLTADAGVISAEASDLFDGDSGSWLFAPTLRLPIFTGGRLSAQLDLAEVRKEIAVTRYEQAIQTAFRETADALAGIRTFGEQLQAEELGLQASQTYYTLARERYDQGVDSYLVVLDAQRSLYRARQSAVVIRLARLVNRVTLYKVLGGGWQERS